MRLLIWIVVAGFTVLSARNLSAAPQLLSEMPVESPDGTYTANVEWDSAGFIGRIKMLIYTAGEKPVKSVELPQMKPAPANLTWISENWVACESFVAEQGAAFFYMDVARERGYLIEILAPDKDGDWIITYTTNDSVSSDTIHTISRDHSSLFPILLRDLPTEGLAYLSPDFAYLMADAVDSFVQWRKKEKFTNIEFLTPIAENPKLGRLAVMTFDRSPELVYFPERTTTTREMLALTRRQELPEGLQAALTGLNPPELKVQWLGESGEFTITGVTEDESTPTELVRGRFEGVSDSAYTGPGVADLLKAAKESSKSDGKGSDSKDDDDDDDDEKSESKKSSSKSSSKSKKPSRSK